MIKQLDNLSFDYEIVEAVDGKALSYHEIKAKYGMETFPPWYSFNARYLAKDEIGCMLSHLRIYRRMIDENIECACILEDDTNLGPDIKIFLKDNFLYKFDWELLLIGHSGRFGKVLDGAECNPLERVFDHYYIAKPIEMPFGTYAYLIRNSAAKKLLQHAYPIRMPMDYLTGQSAAFGVKLRILKPPYTLHNNALLLDTNYHRDRNWYLYCNRIRRLKRFIGEKYPALRTFQRICLIPFEMIPLKLRKEGLLNENSYIEKRYFQSKQ